MHYTYSMNTDKMMANAESDLLAEYRFNCDEFKVDGVCVFCE